MPLGVGNDGSDISITGAVTTAHDPEKATTANSSTWVGELGPYGNTSYATSDDILRSSSPNYRSLGSNTTYSNTSAADVMYTKTENNPFYPAIQGTQKGYANVADNITGTQPYGYGEDDIFAGQFFQFEKGRNFIMSTL